MHSLTAWFIRNPVAANLLMLFILFMGLLTLSTMRIEGFPRMEPDTITISTILSNASPERVDALVSQKIESALEGLEGVRSISTLSVEGLSRVTVRRANDQELDKLLDKVRLRMESGIELPTKAERPIIDANSVDFPALYINLFGETDRNTLNALAKRLKEALLAEPELSRLKLWGLYKQELRIEVDRDKLYVLNLTISDLVERVRANSLFFQAGKLRTQAGQIFIKTDKQARYLSDYQSIPIIEAANGDTVYLGDIAKIYDDFEEGDYLFKFNGENTAGMEVLVGHKENLLHVSEVANRVVDEFRTQLPSGVDISIWGDSAGYIEDRLTLLTNNGTQGLLLVLLILALFLDVKLAFWVAMGIPISVMGAVAVSGTQWVDYSLNDITTFGFIIALGILVDDAVVVGESVYEQRRLHSDPIIGTERGVAKVAVATVFGVLTTVAAFFPMLMLDSPLGKVFAGFSGVVIFALLFSLLESKFILPAHLAAITMDQPARFAWMMYWRRVQNGARGALNSFRDRLYAPLLAHAVRHRYTVLIVFISSAILALGLTAKGKVATVFFPDVPGQIITISLEMDSRSPFALTQKNMARIQEVGQSVNRALQTKYQLVKPPIQTSFQIIMGADSAQLYAELTPISDRGQLKMSELIQQWRQEIGALEGVTELELSGAEEIGGGFAIKLASQDATVLKKASAQLKHFLGNIDGVYHPRDSMAMGLVELEVRPTAAAQRLGFDLETLATQIGYAYGGAEVYKLQRNTDEISVVVTLEAEQRDSIDDLLKTKVRSTDGQWLELASVAELDMVLKPNQLRRENNRQINTVYATINRSVVAPEEVAQAVMETMAPDLQAQFPELVISLGGELEEMGTMRAGLKNALWIALVLIYVLMAVPLKSYGLPFIVLAIIPFGFVGAILGHLYLGLALSVLSLFGMLALAGVVVNDSLVMLTRYNELVEQGMVHHDAIQAAATSRFQAIFLTTTTTVIGLIPLLSETSEQAQYLKPAAASLAFGELFSTLLMMLLVPVLIAITHDLKSCFSSGKHRIVRKTLNDSGEA